MSKVRSHLSMDEFIAYASKPGVFVVDTRPLADFCERYVPHSLNLPLNSNLDVLVRTYFNSESTILFISEKGTEAEAVQKFSDRGVARYLGHLEGGIGGWKGRVSRIEPVTASKVLDLMKKEKIHLLDLREPKHFAQKHVVGAVSIPAERFDLELSSLSPSRTYFVYCTKGNRSCNAVTAMKEMGLKGFLIWNGMEEMSKLPFKFEGVAL